MTNSVDYQGLKDLAESRGIKVAEVTGLDDRNGLRFQKQGKEWIAIDSSLSEDERARTLGFLLENYSQIPASEGIGEGQSFTNEGSERLFTLRCPSI